MNSAWLVVLIPLLPLLAAALIGLRIVLGHTGEDAHERATARAALGAAGLALLAMLFLVGLAIHGGMPGTVTLGDWFGAGPLRFPVSFLLDLPALVMGGVVALIVFLTIRFSIAYMHREPGFHRFFLGLSLFAAGMQLIVLSGNAVFTFIGWELAGVSSYLLIGYAQDRDTATGNALYALVSNRIGDAGLILGIALAFLWVGSIQWQEIGAGARGLDTLSAALLALGFIAAALVKSAQVPFTHWITRALEGPTPSSAVFYGSLMVHAGVYLIIRLEPVLRETPALMVLLAVLGAITAVYGLLCGLVRADVKSSLIHSTVTQVGLMFLACGLGWFEVALWHMALHAAWRAHQFLLSPSYLQLTDRPQTAAAAVLARSPALYNAAQSGFWLDTLARRLLVRPSLALARDVTRFDARLISRLVGLPEEPRGEASPREDALVRGRGAPGGLLSLAAAWAERFERHLVLQTDGGLNRLLGRIGRYMLIVESLLAKPRYLLLLIMATFVVIL